jgi:hypothetical protein
MALITPAQLWGFGQVLLFSDMFKVALVIEHGK